MALYRLRTWTKSLSIAPVIFALSLVLGCGYFESKESVATWVKKSLQEQMERDEAYRGLSLGDVVLIRESYSKFTGYVEFSYRGEIEKAAVTVVLDAQQKLYTVEPPRSLILKRSMSDVFASDQSRPRRPIPNVQQQPMQSKYLDQELAHSRRAVVGSIAEGRKKLLALHEAELERQKAEYAHQRGLFEQGLTTKTTLLRHEHAVMLAQERVDKDKRELAEVDKFLEESKPRD